MRIIIYFAKISLMMFLWLLSSSAWSEVLTVDIRHRPPNMIVENRVPSGPLIDIIRAAVERTGNSVRFQERHFQASYMLLKRGSIDILPRLLCSPERAQEVDFVGPVGYLEKPVYFLVKKGMSNSIKDFGDLKNLRIGVKRGTFYFSKLHETPDLKLVESDDDDNMSRMFLSDRFDTMALIDKVALEKALSAADIVDFEYAKYQVNQHIGIYFGLAKNSKYKRPLQEAIDQMRLSGEIKAAFEKYSLVPPAFDQSYKDSCQ
ncbi:substrate-binding periplasmic protein [Hahella ganghwensis]|uniref:substrate-binding periplasmic protein n=1 Tax=Hahella ganghwensis TaxID=286420 RepID=UPI00035E317F|nr:transporter substrate-binding domain-containing protein [Hahella ganghwensis]